MNNPTTGETTPDQAKQLLFNCLKQNSKHLYNSNNININYEVIQDE